MTAQSCWRSTQAPSGSSGGCLHSFFHNEPIPNIDVRKFGEALLKTEELTEGGPNIMFGIRFPSEQIRSREALPKPYCIRRASAGRRGRKRRGVVSGWNGGSWKDEKSYRSLRTGWARVVSSPRWPGFRRRGRAGTLAGAGRSAAPAVLAGAADFPGLRGSRRRGLTGFGRLGANRRIFVASREWSLGRIGGASVFAVPDLRMTLAV